MKMIAVWGSNGSGKSTISLSLAAALADKKRNVVIVSRKTVSARMDFLI